MPLSDQAEGTDPLPVCAEVPTYPWGIFSKTPTGCLKLWTVLNPIYTTFLPTYAYPYKV